ncbi:charged multivesicular body protein 4b, partial [Clarias magur]
MGFLGEQHKQVATYKAALQALKRKKRYEKQLAQIDGTLSTIEFQREALENANTNTEVIKNMGFAAKAMKAAHDHMDIDKVDELMQDITEQQELAQEISDAISKPVGFGEEFDEDELLAELEELEQEELDKNLLEIGGTENVLLPNVPSTSLPSRPALLRAIFRANMHKTVLSKGQCEQYLKDCRSKCPFCSYTRMPQLVYYHIKNHFQLTVHHDEILHRSFLLGLGMNTVSTI